MRLIQYVGHWNKGNYIEISRSFEPTQLPILLSLYSPETLHQLHLCIISCQVTINTGRPHRAFFRLKNWYIFSAHINKTLNLLPQSL